VAIDDGALAFLEGAGKDFPLGVKDGLRKYLNGGRHCAFMGGI
jgi:hypothetical protein